MASSRHIQNPGVEINEIDRSQYGIEDNTLPNAPVVLTYGFASKGENYSLKWINSKQTLDDTYGQPTNEFEQYFYNSCTEILNRGGMCIAAKLPYYNNALEKYSYVEYEVKFSQDGDSSPCDNVLQSNDSNLTSFMHIECISSNESPNVYATLDEYDAYLTKHGKSLKANHFKIFDITNAQYGKFDGFLSSFLSSTEDELANDFLGIVPVVVTPANAMFFQNLLTSNEFTNSNLPIKFNPIESFTSIDSSKVNRNNLSNLFSLNSNDSVSSYSVVPLYSTQTIANDISTAYYYASQPSLSRTASLTFPMINHNYTGHFAVDHLKEIGVVVFKAVKDVSNNNKLNFKLLESFVGSFDPNARDNVTKASLFIDDVINSQSQCINFFSNIDIKKFEKTSTICTSLQPIMSLGFYKTDCKKHIDFTHSVMNGLTRVIDAASNSYTVPLDIVVDGGVSNVGWLANIAKEGWTDYHDNKTKEYLDVDICPRFSDYQFSFANGNDKGWSLVIKHMNDFVKYTRKDCIFIADGLRAFALDGDVKIVRKSCPKNTVATSIIPNLTHMTNAFDSSYSAGYCNWYYQKDASSGDYIWIPPSIKAAGVYIYCDTYFQPWSAPAGLTRGRLQDVVDVAFTPNEDEAGRIYNAQWNYAMNYPMDGIVIEGHKTFQTARTALDRINVRRLMLYLEKATARLARKFIYEPNTAYLRQRFVDELTPLFDDAMHREGIVEYAIKCDDELNTTQVIENNELRCRIAVKPVKTVDFLVVDFIVTRQNAIVSEEVLR